MSLDTTTLTALLKAVQTATSLSGLSTLFVNGSGELAKMGATSLIQNFGIIRDLDQVLPTGFYQVGYPLTGTLPGSMGPGALTYSMFLSWTPHSDYSIQVFFRATAAEIYLRNYIKGTFTAWYKLAFV